MICCLNLKCQHPQNPDNSEYCHSCGTKLTVLLRGRYRVVRPLGQGGFGKTYLAVDEDRLNARCVIKQFSPLVQGTKSLEKAVQLFQQEAERLNELGEHPQIPTLLAYFEHDQQLYLVQQFIEGQTLLQELAQHGSFGERKIRELLVGILPVLKFVHSHQVIHRDITPSNVIRRTSDNKLVLIDFGVAKVLSTTTSGQPGTKIGTEGYAPMEQIRNGKVFPASDIYSLGATCIYLMTQTKPDDLYDPEEGRWLWRSHLNQRGGTISDALAQILDKMLKDLVSERYQSAGAVIRDLRVALSRPMEVAIAQGGGGPSPILRTSLPRRKSRLSLPPSSPPSAPPSAPPSTGNSGQPAASNNFSFPPSAPIHSGVSRPPSTPPSKPPVSGSQRRPCLHTLTGHTRWVMAVAISPNGQHLASGGLDNTIKVWDLQTGELLQTLSGHTRPVNCVAISPDGQRLVSGGDDCTVRIWNLSTGRVIHTLTEHSKDVKGVAIHAGGQLFASGGDDRTARLWKLTTGEALRTFSNLAGMIRTVAISSDGQTLASAGLDNQIKLWSLKTGEMRTFTRSHFNAVNAIAITPNGKALISGSKDKTIKVWDMSTGEVLRTLTGHTNAVNSIALSANGKLLVSGSSDTTIKLWNVDTGELRSTLNEHSHAVNAVSISPDSRRIASGSSDNTVKVWQVV